MLHNNYHLALAFGTVLFVVTACQNHQESYIPNPNAMHTTFFADQPEMATIEAFFDKTGTELTLIIKRQEIQDTMIVSIGDRITLLEDKADYLDDELDKTIGALEHFHAKGMQMDSSLNQVLLHFQKLKRDFHNYKDQTDQRLNELLEKVEKHQNFEKFIADQQHENEKLYEEIESLEDRLHNALLSVIGILLTSLLAAAVNSLSKK
jgi:chromosome segregation ATPase